MAGVTDRVRARIDELFASGRELPETIEEVARLGAQLLMQSALEAEVTAFFPRAQDSCPVFDAPTGPKGAEWPGRRP
jgi:hypothetical protein